MPEAQNAAVIGIIGGADGPTALFVAAKSEDKAVLTTWLGAAFCAFEEDHVAHRLP